MCVWTKNCDIGPIYLTSFLFCSPLYRKTSAHPRGIFLHKLIHLSSTRLQVFDILLCHREGRGGGGGTWYNKSFHA